MVCKRAHGALLLPGDVLRLLVEWLQPQDIDRALHLDPDILGIGQVRELYEIPLDDWLYAAAMHRSLTGVSGPIGKLRFPDYEADDYFNSGMLLMNLPHIREAVRPEDIFAYGEKNHQALILPDQDVLNGMFGARILPQEEAVWNYDVRRFDTYRIASQGRMDMDWVMRNTVFLHFCGKKKPWNPSFKGRFNALYKHYRALVERYCKFE